MKKELVEVRESVLGTRSSEAHSHLPVFAAGDGRGVRFPLHGPGDGAYPRFHRTEHAGPPSRNGETAPDSHREPL
jgi:hypothetical protein